MKATRVVSFLALAVIAVIFVVRPFNGKVVGLPSPGEPYDPHFEAANAWFDSVAGVHDQDMPILEKIESKLHYIGKGLGEEKEGKRAAFDTLEAKLDSILGQPGAGLPPLAQSYFDSANYNYDSVETVHSWKGELPAAVKSYFFTSNAYFDTVRLIDDSALFADSSELWRIERKLWNLNRALKNEKHAKKGAFEDLEAKLDTLLGEGYSVPEDIVAYLDTADIYFDSVDVAHKQKGKLSDDVDAAFGNANIELQIIESLHWEPIPPEEANIEEKLFHLSLALRFQKEAMFWMAPWFGAFGDLEAKLDTLLGWPLMMNEEALADVDTANYYFFKVDSIHSDPAGPIEQKIEWKVFYLSLGLHYEKMAKELMFTDLENKLDILLMIGPQGLPDSVLSQLDTANQYFLDSAIYVHSWAVPESIKVEWKLHYLKHGLKHQKKAMWWMFRDLEKKIDLLSGREYEGLPPDIDSAFTWADDWLDSVNVIHYEPRYPAWLNIEWKIYFLAKALAYEKEAKWMAFQELKRKLYEFDKVELKLYYLGQALQYQKDAKRRMFEELKRKLDKLLGGVSQGLPGGADIAFQQANYYFDLVDTTHNKPEVPEMEKMEMKLEHLGDALIYQKYAVREMFDTLNVKINTFAHIPEEGLDPDIVTDFDSADYYFEQIELVQHIPGLTELQKIELKIYYLSQGQQFVKEAIEKMFAQWKEKLFEFDKLEKKLHYLGKGSKYQKDAKWLVFQHLEEKMDTLFAWREWEPIAIPPLVGQYFDSANSYFNQVRFTHEDPTIPELTKIPMKIDLLSRGFKYQKDASWLMFENLEQKLDSLKGEPYVSLPDTVNLCFDSANYYFDLVNALYEDPVPPDAELDKMEALLDLFTKALKFAKDAKWLMFDELEGKIDSLPPTEVREMGETETIPETFALLQNYPNPFNPTTEIEFIIPERAQVKLEIFNMLGERIVTLVDRKLNPGRKVVDWDGKDAQDREVSTGIYFCRLKAGGLTQTKKMVFLK
jgi:hypothetical protein